MGESVSRLKYGRKRKQSNKRLGDNEKKKRKCRQGSPKGTAVLPLFILLETEMVENNVLSL